MVLIQEVFSELRMNYQLWFDAKEILITCRSRWKKIIVNYIKKDMIFQIIAL